MGSAGGSPYHSPHHSPRYADHQSQKSKSRKSKKSKKSKRGKKKKKDPQTNMHHIDSYSPNSHNSNEVAPDMIGIQMGAGPGPQPIGVPMGSHLQPNIGANGMNLPTISTDARYGSYEMIQGHTPTMSPLTGATPLTGPRSAPHSPRSGIAMQPSPHYTPMMTNSQATRTPNSRPLTPQNHYQGGGGGGGVQQMHNNINNQNFNPNYNDPNFNQNVNMNQSQFQQMAMQHGQMPQDLHLQYGIDDNNNNNNNNNQGAQNGYHIVDDSKLDSLPTTPQGHDDDGGGHVKKQESFNTPDLPDIKQILPREQYNGGNFAPVPENNVDIQQDDQQSTDTEDEDEN